MQEQNDNHLGLSLNALVCSDWWIMFANAADDSQRCHSRMETCKWRGSADLCARVVSCLTPQTTCLVQYNPVESRLLHQMTK